MTKADKPMPNKPMPKARFSASCLLCGAEFMQSGNDIEIILEAYKVWDKNHGCPHAVAEASS